MSNITEGINLCFPPFIDASLFPTEGGFIDGRLCQKVGGENPLLCCLPCPLTDWTYPSYFTTLTAAANWVAVAGVMICVFLLLSWAVLPADKTSRHYLSVSLTLGVLIMSLGFVVPLAAQPEQCYNEITPHSMHSSKICGASGSLLLLGGWAGVMWVFLRSLSLHLQICWQVLVGRSFMIFSHAVGWGVPIIVLALALVFSGVSFRFGPTCHINHENSMVDFWIPLFIFSGLTVIITFATFGYCIKVYLASLSNNVASTQGSGLPTHSIASLSVTPGQAYRRVRRVITLQWRGIAIVLIIVADVIFFAVIFVYQDNIVQSVADDPTIAGDWTLCLVEFQGDKNKCLQHASSLIIDVATVACVLLLLALNGVWLLFLLGRWSMAKAWLDLLPQSLRRRKVEFVSVDARYNAHKDERSYEMLSKDTDVVVTPTYPVMRSPPPAAAGRKTPDYFGSTARYHAPLQSYSSPQPPSPGVWDPTQTYATPNMIYEDSTDPSGMGKAR